MQRSLHVFVMCLGLSLVVFSYSQSSRVHQYEKLVKHVQLTTTAEFRQLAKDLSRGTVLMPEGAYWLAALVEPLGPLRTGWLLVRAVGGVVLVAGLAGLLTERRFANGTLRARAAPLRS